MLEITRERVASLFRVDLASGRLFWKVAPRCHPEVLGQEAGCSRSSANEKIYWIIKIDGRAYRRGRLIFLFVHGMMPTPCVDHINGDSLDDRPENLRQATVQENNMNHQRRARSTKLPMGVRAMGRRFQARLRFNGQLMCFGTFDTSAAAHSVYLEKRKEFFDESA